MVKYLIHDRIRLILFILFCLIKVFQVSAKDEVNIFITIKPDCSNCNIIAHVYNQVASKYKTQLVFGDMSPKEVKTYLKEYIFLPQTVPYIISDSLMKVLDDFSGGGIGSYLYAYKDNECVYAASLRAFRIKKMQEATESQSIQYEKVPIPDSISFLDIVNGTANAKYYCVYDYTLEKVSLFSLPDYKIAAIITEKDFSDEQIWRTVFDNDTTGLDFARKRCQFVKKYTPNSKMVKITGVTCSKEEVYLWVSVFCPLYYPKTGQKDVVSYKTALVKYNPQKKFVYYKVEPIIDPENKRPPSELSPKPATYYLDTPFNSNQTCIIDSLLYLAIHKAKSETDRPNYPMVVYKFDKNKISFVKFYTPELPQINTFDHVSNYFVRMDIESPIVYYPVSPYYLNIIEKKYTIFPFLPKQDLELSDPKSGKWVIGFMVHKEGYTSLCVYDQVKDRYYVLKLRDNYNYIVEKYSITLPKMATFVWNKANEYLVSIDNKKENILKIPISNL